MLYTQSNIHLILKIANGFEFLPVDVNLGRCQRYFTNYITDNVAPRGFASVDGILVSSTVFYPVTMRASPTVATIALGGGAGAHVQYVGSGGGADVAVTVTGTSKGFVMTVAIGLADRAGAFYCKYNASAEL